MILAICCSNDKEQCSLVVGHVLRKVYCRCVVQSYKFKQCHLIRKMGKILDGEILAIAGESTKIFPLQNFALYGSKYKIC